MENHDFKLSDEQVRFFETFGFLSFPGLLSDRIEEIDREFEAVWETHGGGHDGKPHDGKARSCILPFIDQSEILSTLLDDSRILEIAETLLGEDFNYVNSDGNYYVGETGWHSDGGHKPGDPIHIKIALYLDPLSRDTGALRVIPGSHLYGDIFADGLQEGIKDSFEGWGVHGEDVPALALETQPGDVVCFNHNTKHASFSGGKRRRMFTMNLCQRYPQDRLGDLRTYISRSARFWIDRNYGQKMVDTASPKRMRHLEQVMANDGHLAELTRQAREEMTEPSRG